jgi:hypothetical protein
LPSQAKPSQAKPSQAKPSQAKPSQAKPKVILLPTTPLANWRSSPLEQSLLLAVHASADNDRIARSAIDLRKRRKSPAMNLKAL